MFLCGGGGFGVVVLMIFVVVFEFEIKVVLGEKLFVDINLLVSRS